VPRNVPRTVTTSPPFAGAKKGACPRYSRAPPRNVKPGEPTPIGRNGEPSQGLRSSFPPWSGVRVWCTGIVLQVEGRNAERLQLVCYLDVRIRPEMDSGPDGATARWAEALDLRLLSACG